MRYRLVKDWLILASVILILIWALSSIYILSDKPLIPPKSPNPPRTVKVLMRTGSELDAMRKTIASFEQETEIKVEIIELGRDGYFTALATQLFAGTDTFDAAFIPSTYVAQFALAKAILPLDPFINNPGLTDSILFDMDDFLLTSRYNGRIYALPSDVSTHFLYYRSDLIPRPPETWDELNGLARRFTKTQNPESPTQWGLGMTGLAPEELPKAFDSVLWSFGGDLLGKDNIVYFDTKPSVQAASELYSLVKDRLVPPSLLSWGFAETRDALLQGKIAMAAPYWNAAYSSILNSDSPYKDVIKLAMIPGVKSPDGTVKRVPFMHEWSFAINANSTNQKEAWKFISFATGKHGGQIYARYGGTPSRKSILGDPLLRHIRPEFPLVLQSVELARKEPDVPYYPLVNQYQNEALTRILTLQTDPETAMREASDKLRNLVIQDNLR